MKRGSVIRNSWKEKVNRKLVTVLGVTLLLVGAVAANILIDRSADGNKSVSTLAENEDAVTASAAANFFVSFRNDRETTREQEIAYLDAVITQGADADTLADAQQQKLAIVDSMEKELTIESLIKAKGFHDAAVTLHKGSINVILEAETLSDEQVAQVLDIIIRETGESADNVKISTAQ